MGFVKKVIGLCTFIFKNVRQMLPREGDEAKQNGAKMIIHPLPQSAIITFLVNTRKTWHK